MLKIFTTVTMLSALLFSSYYFIGNNYNEQLSKSIADAQKFLRQDNSKNEVSNVANSSDTVPEFLIDISLPMEQRYQKVLQFFKNDILIMENLFIDQVNKMDKEFLKFIEDNLDGFKEHQPDSYNFAKAISGVLQPLQANFTLSHALLVNSIVDFNSFCTSIVAMNATNVVHVRNLDFNFPPQMQKLIYIQKFINGTGQEVIAEAPSLAGYHGMYTGFKKNKYSLSYNVRYSLHITSRKDEMWTNLKNEINKEYVAAQNFIQKVFLTVDTYDEAVDTLKQARFNTACYLILSNGQMQSSLDSDQKSKYGQGIVLVRSRNQTEHEEILEANSDKKKWFILQTNQDVWTGNVTDPRYEKAENQLNMLHDQFQDDGRYLEQQLLVDRVLRLDGVKTHYTIFAAGMNVQNDKQNQLNIYKAQLKSD